MMKINVSIIIATFNAGKTLERALESIRNQSFQSWECIIVDGASKDSTIDIVKKYVNIDVRFKYISEPDKGIYDAFNKGWKMAVGNLIYYLGSDDALTKDGISELVNKIEDNDVVYGNVILQYQNGKVKLQKGTEKRNFYSPMTFCCHQSVIMKRDVIEKLGGFNQMYCILADWDLLRRAGQNGYKFKYIDIPVAVFSVGGLSSDNYNVPIEAYKIYSKNNTLFISIMTLLKQLIRTTLVKIKHRIM